MRIATAILLALLASLPCPAPAAVSNKLIRFSNAHVNRVLDELHAVTWAQAEGVTLEYQWNTNSFPVDLTATNVLLVFEVADVTNANTIYISATGAVVSATNREVRWIVSPSNANLRPVAYNGWVRALDVVGGTQQNMRVLARQAVTVAASPDASLYNIVGPLGSTLVLATNFSLIAVNGTNFPGPLTLAGGTGVSLRVSGGAAYIDSLGGVADVLSNGSVLVNGQLLTNGAIFNVGGGQATWTNTQNGGGQALTNLSGVAVTGGQVNLVGADVRISQPAYGDNPATKDYVDAGASAYVTNAVNRLVYPDATTNAGVTILGFTDPNFTNVVLTPDGKATLQMKPIPRIEWCFDLTSTSSVMDTTWDDPPVTTNDLTAATGGVWSLYLGRTNHTYRTTNGALVLGTSGASTGYSFSALGQALPAPPWRFEVELGHGTYSNRQICGLAVAETNGGRAYVMSRYRRNGLAGIIYIELAHLSTFTSMGNESLIISWPAPDPRYYALENDGTNFSAWTSPDGVTWSFFAQSLTGNPWTAGANFRPKQIAIMWDWAQNNQTNVVQLFEGSSRWFRRTK